MSWLEAQLDRIVGPTHHFGGLGVGNIASQSHGGQASNPAAAALQGLDKMRLVASLGVPQLILPPQQRPHLGFLRALGFDGNDSEVLSRWREQSPELLSAAMSCSAMWTANAATVTPGCDRAHGSTCLTIANLNASVHRAIEPDETMEELRQTLPGTFQCFAPLPGGAALRDEGAANHMRLASEQGPGVHLFVYGDGDPLPTRYWPRQTLAASQAVVRQHRLDPSIAFYLQQNPRAIDAGAFHNDVVAMSHHELLIHHELAFQAPDETFHRIGRSFHQRTGKRLNRIVVDESSLSLDAAVGTYLFNSQILSVRGATDSERVILCPVEVEQNPQTLRLVRRWQAQGLFSKVHFVDLGQSMNGGGGPACLRLRIPLRFEELDSLPSHRLWNERVDTELRQAINEYYPSRVTIDDLGRTDYMEQAILARDRTAAILSPARSEQRTEGSR